ncbi:MAG TPA: DNA polymerase ligase N-terminal domain-containing protein [Gemmatimonadaceae bacterium]
MPARTVQRPARKRPRSTKRPGTLRLYHEKRNLAASGEPGEAGAEQPKVGAIRRYVIQKHDATRLHYDFRLEMEGVYRSWAVPKGLPTEAGERTLAVEVEDHPLAYGNFEGTIPEGNYGAGTVMLWDRGNYTVSGVEPEVAYRQGKIHLALAGEKCVGEWTLVRMRPRPNDKHNNWLMIKNSGPQHRAPVTGAERERSVLSGRTMEEIDAGKDGGRGETETRGNGVRG